jgi:eukaryotic-like serine/threonine-protein kinase
MLCPSCGAPNEDSRTACGGCGRLLGPRESVVVSVDLKPGTLFHGRYEIVGPLGRGGMGMVYRAHDRTLDETVAIKILRPEFAEDPTMGERFKSEIKLARKVRHRNVCAIHDFGEDRGLAYISMELVDGQDLKRVLGLRGALPPDEAYGIAVQVSEGLEAVHAARIIHRDLKTSNIVVDRAGVARLMDFGIAKRTEGTASLTATGHILGSPEYMSPEQAQGKRVDARTDIYALGIVIYEIFAGQVPFRGDTPIATILKQMNDPPPLDHGRLPIALRPVLHKALAKDPGDRYATARALTDALQDARARRIEQRPAPTEAMRRAPAPPPPTRSGLRSRLWWLGLPVAGAGVAVFLLRSPSPTASGPPPALAPSSVPPPSLPPVTTPMVTRAESTAASVATPTPGRIGAPTIRSATALPPRPTASPEAVARPGPSPSASAPTPSQPIVPSAPPSSTPRPVDPGLLQIAVRPWAEVEVDGRLLGTTPLDRMSLPAGQHVVLLRHPSFEPFTRAVTIRPGELARLVVDLPREGVPLRH